MFETAITYLTDSEESVETILVGGLLTLFAWLLLPAVLVSGYLQRVLARTIAGESAPAFEEWGDLFWEGLKAVAVALAYFAVPILLGMTLLASLVITSVETTVVESPSVADPGTVAEPVTTGGPDPLTVVVLLGALAVATVTSLVAWYTLPAALSRLAVEGRLGAAFEFRKVARVVTDGSYATGWLVALVVLLVGGALVGGLASIPLVGWALVPFAGFYLNVVAFSLYGQGYREATRTDRGETVEGGREVPT